MKVYCEVTKERKGERKGRAGKGGERKERKEIPNRKWGLSGDLLWATTEVDGPLTIFVWDVEPNDAIHIPRGHEYIYYLHIWIFG